MTLDTIEQQLWAAFPKADEVMAQPMFYGTRIGIGVRLDEYKTGVHFDPKKVKPSAAIKQLRQRIVSEPA